MNPETTLLLVGANDETVQKAKQLGLTVLLLQHPSKLSDEQERLADHTRVLDYTDWAEVRPVAEELRTSPGFGAALSITEAGLENAGRINDLFGLGGTGFEVAQRIRDKWAMRLHLAGLDPAAVAAAPLVKREDLDVFAGRHGFPFIVKPTDGTASLGVFRVAAPEDADRVWAEVERLRGTRTDRISTLFVLQDFLMEEYVDGPEFSVESFSFAGRHVVVAITEKFVDPRHFAELGHAVPARLDPAVADQVGSAYAAFSTWSASGTASATPRSGSVRGAPRSSRATTASPVTPSPIWCRARTASTWSPTPSAGPSAWCPNCPARRRRTPVRAPGSWSATQGGSIRSPASRRP